jgi:ABC-type sugar transport system permease subunit
MELTVRRKGSDRKEAFMEALHRGVGFATPYLYITPAMIFFVLFLAYPVYFSLKLSFYEWNGLTGKDKIKYVGLANYLS